MKMTKEMKSYLFLDHYFKKKKSTCKYVKLVGNSKILKE